MPSGYNATSCNRHVRGSRPMKVAMKRTVLVAVICFAAALVVSVAFLVWFNADPDANIATIRTSLPLSYLYAVSSGLAAFSVGALVALVAVEMVVVIPLQPPVRQIPAVAAAAPLLMLQAVQVEVVSLLFALLSL